MKTFCLLLCISLASAFPIQLKKSSNAQIYYDGVWDCNARPISFDYLITSGECVNRDNTAQIDHYEIVPADSTFPLELLGTKRYKVAELIAYPYYKEDSNTKKRGLYIMKLTESIEPHMILTGFRVESKMAADWVKEVTGVTVSNF